MAVGYTGDSKEPPQASLPATDDTIQIVGPVPEEVRWGYERRRFDRGDNEVR